jgi:hypothetical protein
VIVEVVLFFIAGATSHRAPTNNLTIWTGSVSTTGTSTITVAYSGGVTSIETGLAAQQFSASSGSSTVWGKDTGGGISNASSTTATLPKLAPSGSGELYFGYGAMANTGSVGTTPGFSYATTSDNDVAAYSTKVSSAVQPTATQSPSGVSGGLAVLITASGSSSSSPPTISAVGSLATKSGNGTTTLAVSPRQAGDLLVLAVKVSSSSVTASSVSGGGVSTWTKAEGPSTGYAAQGPGTLSNFFFLLFLIVIVALIVFVIYALVRRPRSQAS